MEFFFTFGYRKVVKDNIADAALWLRTDSETKFAKDWEVPFFLVEAEKTPSAKEENFLELGFVPTPGNGKKTLAKTRNISMCCFRTQGT